MELKEKSDKSFPDETKVYGNRICSSNTGENPMKEPSYERLKEEIEKLKKIRGYDTRVYGEKEYLMDIAKMDDVPKLMYFKEDDFSQINDEYYDHEVVKLAEAKKVNSCHVCEKDICEDESNIKFNPEALSLFNGKTTICCYCFEKMIFNFKEVLTSKNKNLNTYKVSLNGEKL